MSTILDALRKVQRERDRESPDLRHALTEELAPQSDGFGAGHWMVVAGLVLLAGGVSAYLFVGGDRPAEAISAQATDPDPDRAAPESTRLAVAQAPEADPDQSKRQLIRGALRERLDGLSRGRPRTSQPGTRSVKRPAVTSASSRIEIAQAIVARNSHANSHSVEGLDAEGLEAEPAFEKFDEPVRVPAPVASSGPRASAPEPPAPVARDPRPVAEPEPVRVAAVTPPSRAEPAREPVAAKPDPDAYPDPDLFSVRFPDLRLEAVRWHPDSTRREARLLIDSTRSVSAREGDVIVGVAVYRIEPGAVELRLGDTIRLIRVGQ